MAVGATQRIIVEILAKSDQAVAGLRKTGTEAELMGKRVQSSSATSQGVLAKTGISGKAMGLAVAGGAALAVAGIAKFAAGAANSYVDLVTSVRQLHRITGDTMENSSRLAFAFKRTGIDVETAGKAFFRFEKQVGSGKVSLDDMGITLKKNKDGSVDTAQAVLDLSGAFSKMSGSARAAKLSELFGGRAGTTLLPLLTKTKSEIQAIFDLAAKDHQIFTDKDGENVGRYKKALAELDLAFQGFQVQIGKAALPALEALTNAIRPVADLLNDNAGAVAVLGEAFTATVVPILALWAAMRAGKFVVGAITEVYQAVRKAVVGTEEKVSATIAGEQAETAAVRKGATERTSIIEGGQAAQNAAVEAGQSGKLVATEASESAQTAVIEGGQAAKVSAVEAGQAAQTAAIEVGATAQIAAVTEFETAYAAMLAAMIPGAATAAESQGVLTVSMLESNAALDAMVASMGGYIAEGGVIVAENETIAASFQQRTTAALEARAAEGGVGGGGVPGFGPPIRPTVPEGSRGGGRLGAGGAGAFEPGDIAAPEAAAAPVAEAEVAPLAAEGASLGPAAAGALALAAGVIIAAKAYTHFNDQQSAGVKGARDWAKAQVSGFKSMENGPDLAVKGLIKLATQTDKSGKALSKVRDAVATGDWHKYGATLGDVQVKIDGLTDRYQTNAARLTALRSESSDLIKVIDKVGGTVTSAGIAVGEFNVKASRLKPFEDDPKGAEGFKKSIIEAGTVFNAFSTQMLLDSKLSNDGIAEITKSTAQLDQQISSSFAAATSPIQAFGSATHVSGKEFQDFLTTSNKQAHDWANGLQEAAKLGIDQGLIDQISAAGPKALPILQGLLEDAHKNGVGAVNATAADTTGALAAATATVNAKRAEIAAASAAWRAAASGEIDIEVIVAAEQAKQNLREIIALQVAAGRPIEVPRGGGLITTSARTKISARGGRLEKGEYSTVVEEGPELFIPGAKSAPTPSVFQRLFGGKKGEAAKQPTLLTGTGPSKFVAPTDGYIVSNPDTKRLMRAARVQVHRERLERTEHRERGGEVRRGTEYVVNEKGHEVFLPGIRESQFRSVVGTHRERLLTTDRISNTHEQLVHSSTTPADAPAVLVGVGGPQVFVPPTSGTIIALPGATPSGSAAPAVAGVTMSRASGGTVSAGSAYMVGERVAEVFVKSPPRGALSSSSTGGNTYHINVNVAAGADAAEVGREAVNAIKAYERRNGDSWRR